MKDTIYRQAVIDKINEIYCYLSLSYKPKEYETARALFLDIRSAIKTMPSAEPNIIRCKDCKWKQGSECVRFADVRPFRDDFCSRAERRTNEND